MEDFGYQKDGEHNKLFEALKKIFLASSTLFSIAGFIYITINAYHFAYPDKEEEIQTINSPEGPIKIIENEQNTDDTTVMQIDHSIYEDIFGNKKDGLRHRTTTIRSAPEPALPPKRMDLIPESVPIVTTTPETSKLLSSDNQKIIVYSDKPKNEKADKDLLTNLSGEERPVAPKSAAPKKRSVRVQVAAMTSKSAAEEQWRRLNRAHSNLFSGLKPFTEAVDLGKKGIFYRLQIGNFYNQVEAEEFCSRYVAQTGKTRADCIVVE